MTSSLPHRALLEDLSKTCGCALPARCKWMGCWTPVCFFLCLRVCVCVCASRFVSLSWISCLSLSPPAFDFMCCSSGLFQQVALRSLRHNRGPPHRTGFQNAGACVHTSVTPSDTQSKNNRERHFLCNYLIQRDLLDLHRAKMAVFTVPS